MPRAGQQRRAAGQRSARNAVVPDLGAGLCFTGGGDCFRRAGLCRPLRLVADGTATSVDSMKVVAAKSFAVLLVAMQVMILLRPLLRV